MRHSLLGKSLNHQKKPNKVAQEQCLGPQQVASTLPRWSQANTHKGNDCKDHVINEDKDHASGDTHRSKASKAQLPHTQPIPPWPPSLFPSIQHIWMEGWPTKTLKDL